MPDAQYENNQRGSSSLATRSCRNFRIRRESCGRKVAVSTLALAAVVSLLVLSLLPRDGDGVQKFRELALQQDLVVMRNTLNEYVADNHKRPQTLKELVITGYLKSIPVDPVTKRANSWVVEWSHDAKMTGIVNIRSGSRSTSSKGTAYRDW